MNRTIDSFQGQEAISRQLLKYWHLSFSLKSLLALRNFSPFLLFEQYLIFLLQCLSSSLDFVNSDLQKCLICLDIAFKGFYFSDAFRGKLRKVFHCEVELLTSRSISSILVSTLSVQSFLFLFSIHNFLFLVFL